MSCNLERAGFLFGLLFEPVDGGVKFLRISGFFRTSWHYNTEDCNLHEQRRFFINNPCFIWNNFLPYEYFMRDRNCGQVWAQLSSEVPILSKHFRGIMITKIKFTLWSQCIKSVLHKLKSHNLVFGELFVSLGLSATAFAFLLCIWTFIKSSSHLVFTKIYIALLKRSANTREGTLLPKYCDVEVKWVASRSSHLYITESAKSIGE
jgi:hypothetical protein